MAIDHREFLPVSNWIQELPHITALAVNAALSPPTASASSRRRNRAVFHHLLTALQEKAKCAATGTGNPGAGGFKDYSPYLVPALPGTIRYRGETAVTWHHLALEKANYFLSAVSLRLSDSVNGMCSPEPRFDQSADESWEPSDDQNQAIRQLVAQWKSFDSKRIASKVARERMIYATKFGLVDASGPPETVQAAPTADDVLTIALQELGISPPTKPFTDVQKRQVIFAWWKDCGHVQGGAAALRDEWNRRGLLPALPAKDRHNSKQTLTRGRLLVDEMRAAEEPKKRPRRKNVPGCTQ